MSEKIYEIHFRESPLGREVYRELRELKEKHRASWVKVLAMLLNAYHKLESGKSEEQAPSISEQPFSVYVLKSRHTYTLYSNQMMRHVVPEPYWMHKYIGKRMLYFIVARSNLYKAIGRVFEEKGENGTRKYVLTDIRIIGFYVPNRETLDSIKKIIWMKVNELCNKDHTCRSVDVEPELNRIYYIVR